LIEKGPKNKSYALFYQQLFVAFSSPYQRFMNLTLFLADGRFKILLYLSVIFQTDIPA